MPTDQLTPLTLTALARCGGGRLLGDDCAFDQVSIDSRHLLAGMLFAALPGERADGHDYAMAAAERGACGLLVTRQLPVPLPQVIVPDTLRALAACAQVRRRAFRGPVVAVTGSNGKTTTKEMLGAILAGRGPCLVTQGNLNNHIGVPLTLLGLRAEHQSAVIEMGANHAGEIAYLASLAEPTVGLLTNAGAAHLEGFGSIEGVAAAKGELFAALPLTGTAVINADDAFAPMWRTLAAGRPVVTFGLDAPADFTARNIDQRLEPSGPVQSFGLVFPGGARRARLYLAGRHNLRNALGAAAAAHAAGATIDDVVRGLGSVKPVKGRLNVQQAVNGAVLVDDSYNANPGSLRAGLDAIQPWGATRWLILGDMLELGDRSDDLHTDMGRVARAAGIERLLAFGPKARLAAAAFGSGAECFDQIDDLVAEARRGLAPGAVVLVKGSRANRLERVVAALAAPEEKTT